MEEDNVVFALRISQYLMYALLRLRGMFGVITSANIEEDKVSFVIRMWQCIVCTLVSLLDLFGVSAQDARSSALVGCICLRSVKELNSSGHHSLQYALCNPSASAGPVLHATTPQRLRVRRPQRT